MLSGDEIGCLWMAIRMLSLEKYRMDTWKSSSWVATPSTTGERVRRINWFEANVKILDANWIKIKKLVPAVDEARTWPIRVSSGLAMLMAEPRLIGNDCDGLALNQSDQSRTQDVRFNFVKRVGNGSRRVGLRRHS